MRVAAAFSPQTPLLKTETNMKKVSTLSRSTLRLYQKSQCQLQGKRRSKR